MNRQEKRKYNKEAKERSKIQGKPYPEEPKYLGKSKLSECFDNIVVLQNRMNLKTNIQRIMGPSIRGSTPDYVEIDGVDVSHLFQPSSTWESVAPFMTLQEARSAAGLEPLEIEQSNIILVGTPRRGIPDMYSYLFEDTDYLQEIAAYFGISVNWIKELRGYSQSQYFSEQVELEQFQEAHHGQPTYGDIMKIKTCVRYKLPLETIILAIDSPLSVNWWARKYNQHSCKQCKSYLLENNLETNCGCCNKINHHFPLDRFKHKDTYCSFCADELKRIKAGDTPCPIDTTEGLLL